MSNSPINEQTPAIKHADLPDGISVVARDVRRGKTLWTLGLCILAGEGLLALAIAIWIPDSWERHAGSHAAAVLLAALLGGIAWIGLRLFRQGRRLLHPDALTVLGEDTRRPVLFLRSFTDEAENAADGIRVNYYESTLGDAVAHIGPFVAVGAPDEKLGDVTAARFYVNNTEWRSAVLNLIRRSEMVILWAAPKESVRWELEQAVKHLHPEQLLLFFHLGGRSREARSRDTAKAVD